MKPPLQRKLTNIRIDLIFLEKKQFMGYTFSQLIAWVQWSIFIQIYVVASDRHVCNATERIIAVQCQFRVIQGR